VTNQPQENLGPQSDENPAPHNSEHGPLYPVPSLSFEVRVHGAFLGPDGLRAGWRFLTYIAMAWSLYWVLVGSLSYAEPFVREIWLRLLVQVALLVSAVMPALVMARIEQRPFDVYGLPRRGAFGKLFWLGAVWGIVALTVLMLAMRGSGVFYFGGLALHGVRILKFAAYWGLFFLLVGLSEEFVSRGYTQFTLTPAIGFWRSAVLLSLGFGALHLRNEGETWIGALAAACIGLFFCLTLRRTGNLWFAVGFHASWDWGETYLYSVPNSGIVASGHLLSSSFAGSHWLNGGSVGPEGSVFAFGLIALLWVAFDRMYPEIKYPGAGMPPAQPAGRRRYDYHE
jgi:membrane protease YdiL (CAAX protease family)